MKAFKIFLLFVFALLASGVSALEDTTPPVIEDAMLDNKLYFPGDIIASRPKVSAKIFDDGTGLASIEVWVDSTLVYYGSPAEALDPDTALFAYRLTKEQKLAPGTYTIYIRAWDFAGNSSWKGFSNLKVIIGLPKVYGPSCYPLTFSPTRGEKGNVVYSLSFDSDLRILIYERGGKLVWSRDVSAGEELGRRGFNRLCWRGRDGSGRIVSNGVYQLRIVAGNRVLGSGSFIIND